MKTDKEEIFMQFKKLEDFINVHSKNSKSISDLVIDFFNDLIKESDFNCIQRI